MSFVDAGTGAGTQTSTRSASDALDYLQSVYNDPLQPTNTRLRAASIAIEYERPRLAVTALIDGKDFAARLERALVRSAKVTKVIEPKPKPEPPPVKPPLPTVTDRRFRRI
jgi:hypothetical protein